MRASEIKRGYTMRGQASPSAMKKKKYFRGTHGGGKTKSTRNMSCENETTNAKRRKTCRFHLGQPVRFHTRSQKNVEEEDCQQGAREEHKVSHENDRPDVT